VSTARSKGLNCFCLFLALDRTGPQSLQKAWQRAHSPDVAGLASRLDGAHPRRADNRWALQGHGPANCGAALEGLHGAPCMFGPYVPQPPGHRPGAPLTAARSPLAAPAPAPALPPQACRSQRGSSRPPCRPTNRSPWFLPPLAPPLAVSACQTRCSSFWPCCPHPAPTSSAPSCSMALFPPVTCFPWWGLEWASSLLP
jgi:hypothetical protein